MPAAVLTVHQLRFQLAFGGETKAKLASEGHAYLGALAPLAAMLVAIAAGLFLARLALAARDGLGPDETGRLSFRRAWLIAAAALLAIYCVQELAEGLLISGHPGGLAGVFGEGGWLAAPLALALGAVVAAALRVSDAAVTWVASRVARPTAPPRRPRRAPRPAPVFRFAPEPLAAAAAGRAPPAGLATSF
jgi:hypothetical protein